MGSDVVLSASISLQQIGLQYTKVANAGFISSLYVVIVPLLGVLFRHRTGIGASLGATLAAVGMYFLSVSEQFSMLYGDWYQLAGALVISVQMMLVGRFASRHDPLMLALVQFVTCGIACLLVGLAIEPINLAVIVRAAPTILYSGALSVGVAYTIQVVAQKHAAPSHAAVMAAQSCRGGSHAAASDLREETGIGIAIARGSFSARFDAKPRAAG